MSLPRAIAVGALVGAVAALGIFVSMGPDDLGRVDVQAPPTFAPVPTPTVTQLNDCVPPAVLKKGYCVTTKPGPRVVVQVPWTGSTTSAQRTAPQPAPAPRTADQQNQDQPDDNAEPEHEDEHDD